MSDSVLLHFADKWDEPCCVLEGGIHALGTLFNIDSDFLSIQEDSCLGKTGSRKQKRQSIQMYKCKAYRNKQFSLFFFSVMLST